MKVTVNGEEFGNDICMFQLQRISQEKPGISEKEAKKEITENIIKHCLLKQAADKKVGNVPEKQIETELNRLKQNYPSEAEFQKMCAMNRTSEELIKKDIEQSLKINIFVRDLTKMVPPPPTHIMKKYYERERKVSMKPKEIHAAHIVKKIDPANPETTYNEMLEIRKKLLDGAKFADVADEHSSCNDKGGDLGYFARGKMVEEFDVIAFSMNKDEISPIFQTPFGYHIATVYDIKKPERLSFEECKDDIKAEITAKLQDEAVDKWIEKEKPNADIKIED
jgi:parvulin-like peptidyl-prolyl isomerase